jgi:hypothetical protein
MPTAIAPAVAWVIGAASATATAVVVISNAIVLLGSLALSSYQKRKAERAAKAQFDAAQVDRLANVPSTVASREMVLGRVRKGGHVFFKTSVGQYKELFIMCVALASHEIDGVEQIYLNDQPIELDADGRVITAPYGRATNLDAKETLPAATTTLSQTPVVDSVKITREFFGGIGVTEVTDFTVAGNVVTITEDFVSGQIYRAYYQYPGYNSFVKIRAHLGSPDQTADGAMTAMLPGIWTADHRARGVAYLICEFAYNDGALPSGIPTVTAQIRGAKVYDLRTGLTQFSENPAVLMRHVMLHPQFGKRTSLSFDEEQRIAAASNACDTLIAYDGNNAVPMYRSAIVVPFGAPARDVFDDLSQSMGGEWAYAAGEFFLRPGVYQLPVMDLTDADLAVVQRTNDGSVSQNSIKLSPHQPRNEKFNMVAIRIWDQAAKYIETPITPFRADALVAADGAELSQEVTMPAVFFAAQAYHIAGIMLRDSRDPLTVTLPFKMRAYPLELFDGVRLTLARYGWTNKEFRVLARTFSPDGLVQLTLKETTSQIFAYGAGFIPGGYTPNTDLPQPWEIDPPTLLSVDSGEGELVVQSDGTILNGVRVTWAPIADRSVLSGGEVELQYRVLPDGAWTSVIAPGDATEVKFAGVPDLAMILIRLRTRNNLAASEWGAQALHQVIGKTEPPPNIENLSIAGSVLSWSLPRRVPDLAGFVFRFHYGNNLDWGTAVPLHTGVLTESPYDLVTRPGGPVTIMGKAIDTSGNMSKATANILMNLGDPPIANIVEEIDFKALGWPSSRVYLPIDNYLLTDQSGNYLVDEDGNYLTVGLEQVNLTEQTGWTEVDGVLKADALDSFYGDDAQSFYGMDLDSLYDEGSYSQMVYVTGEVVINSALLGSVMTLIHQTQGVDLRIEYRMPGPGSFYGSDNQSFYGADSDPMYGPPGPWQPWPGQIIAGNLSYQFRITIGAGVVQGVIEELNLVIDAPDMEEEVADVAVSSGGTVVPSVKPFTVIKTVQATLQAGSTGARTVEIDKTNPLAPVIRALDASGAPVSGATVDITLKGY